MIAVAKLDAASVLIMYGVMQITDTRYLIRMNEYVPIMNITRKMKWIVLSGVEIRMTAPMIPPINVPMILSIFRCLVKL